MILVTVVTIFPEMFPGPLGHSLLGKSLGKLWNLKTVNIRDFAMDKHNTVDDSPYGGGAGMVMKADVVDLAMRRAISFYEKLPSILFMTPRGAVFSSDIARDIMHDNQNGMIILCGRYEGIDQRVIDFWKEKYCMVEISIGDYILFGGEIPAIVVIDSCLRFANGIMHNTESTKNESFSAGLLEYPQYTKPAIWNCMEVPKVLLSGNHKEIELWRTAQAEKITKEVRPDVWEKYENKG
ncbi:MAG: tRNA (guanosine(37)-N1)-methyltransferase TrmD [Holosporales bacterium]|jgi:tRNA (guanine37-N1)-methyltransferase|nr:tRNA (guanosine(37)-N1)-methyltransferase TrmD [Holosporales bacterium]